jgi:hypothetical protein
MKTISKIIILETISAKCDNFEALRRLFFTTIPNCTTKPSIVIEIQLNLAQPKLENTHWIDENFKFSSRPSIHIFTWILLFHSVV